MKEIVYFVASSLDGYIAGPKGDCSLFSKRGSITTRYRDEAADFDTVIMCRQHYEACYGYGLQAGQPVFPGKAHYILSNSLTFSNAHPSMHVISPTPENVQKLRSDSSTGIFLCGSGPFAGWLLENGLIDRLKVQINPIIQGAGMTLFGSSTTSLSMDFVSSTAGGGGVQLNEYRIHHGAKLQDEAYFSGDDLDV